MTSTRSRTTKRSAATRTAAAETPKDAFVSLARHTARIQIAAATAGARFMAGWAHAAERYAQTVGDELLRRVEGQTDSSELLARVASATTTHLRDVTTLPGEAADHFNSRLSEGGETA
jgi:ABC-type sugar transport system substrate-binding protein